MLYTKEDDLKRLDEPDFREKSATNSLIRQDFLMRSCGYYPKFSTYAKLFSNYINITGYDNPHNLVIGRPWWYDKDEEVYAPAPDIDEILLFLKVMHITPNTLTKVVRSILEKHYDINTFMAYAPYGNAGQVQYLILKDVVDIQVHRKEEVDSGDYDERVYCFNEEYEGGYDYFDSKDVGDVDSIDHIAITLSGLSIPSSLDRDELSEKSFELKVSEEQLKNVYYTEAQPYIREVTLAELIALLDSLQDSSESHYLDVPELIDSYVMDSKGSSALSEVMDRDYHENWSMGVVPLVRNNPDVNNNAPGPEGNIDTSSDLLLSTVRTTVLDQLNKLEAVIRLIPTIERIKEDQQQEMLDDNSE